MAPKTTKNVSNFFENERFDFQDSPKKKSKIQLNLRDKIQQYQTRKNIELLQKFENLDEETYNPKPLSRIIFSENKLDNSKNLEAQGQVGFSKMQNFLPDVKKSNDGKISAKKVMKKNLKIVTKSGGDDPLRLSITKL